MIQSDFSSDLRQQCATTSAHVASVVRALDPGQLNEHPEPTGWSVGEVLEHLCISDELYEKPLKALIATARPDAGAPMREWKPTILGNMLCNMLSKPGKMKAPRKFQPGPTPRNGILDGYLGADQRVMSMMSDAASLDWRKQGLVSPALPSFMPKFNLGDIFRIHAVHTARHARQIDRLVALL